MRSALVVATTILLAATPALASDEKPVDAHGIGGAIGTISGSGFSYVRTYASGWGWHVSGVGWGQGGNAFVNVGGAVTREIDRRGWGTLYGLLGLGAGLSGFTGSEAGLSPTLTPQTNLTPGLGFTWGPIMVELGLSAYYNSGGFGFGPAYNAGLYWWL